MTLLEINLTDVLSETDPDDRVLVWAPVFREGPAGQLVGTRRKAIPLTDGVGSDEVVPGPLMVQVQCKAMSDTRPREVVVPEVGQVTLTALFDSAGDFTYAPPVVGQVAQYRNEAIQAAADAETAATTAATNVETQLSGYVTDAEDAAVRAEAAAQSAETGVQPDTVGRAHLTPALRGEIDEKVTAEHEHSIADVSGLQPELDARSQLGHTHTIEEVTGLEDALASAGTGSSISLVEDPAGSGLYTIPTTAGA